MSELRKKNDQAADKKRDGATDRHRQTNNRRLKSLPERKRYFPRESERAHCQQLTSSRLVREGEGARVKAPPPLPDEIVAAIAPTIDSGRRCLLQRRCNSAVYEFSTNAMQSVMLQTVMQVDDHWRLFWRRRLLLLLLLLLQHHSQLVQKCNALLLAVRPMASSNSITRLASQKRLASLPATTSQN